jgi:hypothetical protein
VEFNLGFTLVIGWGYKGTYRSAARRGTPSSSPFHHILTLITIILMAQVIVVGGGLAGLSAAHTLLERGANVLLLDKQGYVGFTIGVNHYSWNSCRFMGGNSTKATSGINGAGTQTQQEAGIPDNAKIFFEDTKKSVSEITFLPQVLH